MDLTPRPYEDRDLPGILAAWGAASRLAHPFLSDAYLEQERHDIEHVYLPNTETWVVEVDGAVVGFVSLIDNEVGGLFVHPDHHGRGLGRALVDQARRRHPVLEVEVFAANAIGRRFYAAYGFGPESSRIHPETGERLLRLRVGTEGDPPR